jgi:hypothetical protein
MVTDPFELLYARYRVNVPKAKERYSVLSDELLSATTRTATSHIAHGSATAVGQLTAKAAGRAPGMSYRSAFKPKGDLVLGLAFNAMAESNNSVVAATGEVFGKAAVGIKVRLMLSANAVGAALIIAYEVYNTTNKILTWMEKREDERFMREHDLIQLHWLDTARKARNSMKLNVERLGAERDNPRGFLPILHKRHLNFMRSLDSISTRRISSMPFMAS